LANALLNVLEVLNIGDVSVVVFVGFLENGLSEGHVHLDAQEGIGVVDEGEELFQVDHPV
jgi:hypothetical protein